MGDFSSCVISTSSNISVMTLNCFKIRNLKIYFKLKKGNKNDSVHPFLSPSLGQCAI